MQPQIFTPKLTHEQIIAIAHRCSVPGVTEHTNVNIPPADYSLDVVVLHPDNRVVKLLRYTDGNESFILGHDAQTDTLLIREKTGYEYLGKTQLAHLLEQTKRAGDSTGAATYTAALENL
jgi:hypothetical protein